MAVSCSKYLAAPHKIVTRLRQFGSLKSHTRRTMSASLFTEDTHTANYAKYRFSCPEDVVKAVVNYGDKRSMNSPFEHILDVGCGSGQATNIFASIATKITAIDISENQIKHAKLANQYGHVTYCVGTAECLPVEDNSVDVINSTQAIHWVDLDKFFKECERVLKPNGFISLNGNFGPKIKAIKTANEKKIGDAEKLLELTNNRLTDFIRKLPHHPLTKPLVKRYKTIHERLPSQSKCKVDSTMTVSWTLDRFHGELTTWSAYQCLMKQARDTLKRENGEIDEEELKKHDVIETLIEDIRQLWGIVEDNSLVQLQLEWDIFVVLSGKPFL